MFVRTVWFFDGSPGVATLSRAGNGSLSFSRCLTGDTSAGPQGSGSCAVVPGAQPDGLNFLGYLALSPDGKHLYTTSYSDAARTASR